MRPESHAWQLTNLELSKKLKELGVTQESLFYWQCDVTWVRKGQKDGSIPYIFHSEHRKVVFKEDTRESNDDYSGNYRVTRSVYSAFTVAELGEMLPNYICSYNGGNSSWFCNSKFEDFTKTKKGVVTTCVIATTEADARAKMLIYLKEKEDGEG